jgi:hypothetical protein
MSVKSKYKTSSALVREGVWFDLDKNSDGTPCRFKLRRTGRGNPLWSKTFREHTADVDLELVSPEEDELITANVFAEANVVEWEGFQPEDDGTVLPFSTENAKAILTDPDWVELLKDLQLKANGIAAFQQKREGEAGN